MAFREKNGGLGGNQLIQEQIGEPDMSREAKEIVRLEAVVSEGIERSQFQFNTAGMPLKAQDKAQRANRRRKIRVYFPCTARTHR